MDKVGWFHSDHLLACAAVHGGEGRIDFDYFAVVVVDDHAIACGLEDAPILLLFYPEEVVGTLLLGDIANDGEDVGLRRGRGMCCPERLR